MLCAKCGKNAGTLKWTGEGGALAMVHGFYEMWCERCATEAQLEYARRQASRISELETKLKDWRP